MIPKFTIEQAILSEWLRGPVFVIYAACGVDFGTVPFIRNFASSNHDPVQLLSTKDIYKHYLRFSV